VFWSTGESIDTCSQSEYWNVPSENVWHQIICTYDSTSTPKGRKTIFIDGEKVYECTSNIRATANNFDLLIGSRLNNGYSPDAFFQGTIDELRIYNRAFGDCEAAQSFKSYTITPTLANKNNVYYTKGGIYSLTGNPTGGVFSGTGINNNKFDASALSQGTHKISYTYRDKNSCNWESDFYLNIDTGYVTSVEADDDSYLDFDVLPNPLSLDFTIKSVADITGFSILEITNAIGNVVSKSEIEFINGMYNGTINRSIIPNGIYFFRIINGHHSGVDKVVIVE
jgi:hypothetical protein